MLYLRDQNDRHNYSASTFSYSHPDSNSRSGSNSKPSSNAYSGPGPGSVAHARPDARERRVPAGGDARSRDSDLRHGRRRCQDARPGGAPPAGRSTRRGAPGRRGAGPGSGSDSPRTPRLSPQAGSPLVLPRKSTLQIGGWSRGALASIGALGFALSPLPLVAAVSGAVGGVTADASGGHREHVRLGNVAASKEVGQIADWVMASRDNGALPFLIVDKLRAKVFVFDAHGFLQGQASVLLGLARGDDTIAGIGDRKLSEIRPEERTTPAGRFVGALGHDLQQDILWVDYDAALSLHRVITGAKSDHRLQRLSTASARDKRISYGCINVPASFYDQVVKPQFAATGGIIYILPEVKSLTDVFPNYHAAG